MSKKLEATIVDFKEYFDKNLKPKKTSMKNLDREICVDVLRKVDRDAREEILNTITSAANIMKMMGYEDYSHSLETLIKSIRA